MHDRGAAYDPWGVQSIMAQGSDEGLRTPMPEWYVINQALPARCPSCRLDHIGFHRCFIYKSKSLQMVGHEGLAPGNPDTAQVGDILALLLKCLQIFFCVTIRAGVATARLRNDVRSAHVP